MIVDRFANASALNWLWTLPIFFFLSTFLARRSRTVWQKAVNAKLLPVLIASQSLSKRKVKLVLELAALLFFVVALARPQSGESRQKVKSEGIEIMLAVDVSQSMMAEDVRPSRLGLAKAEINRFLDSVGGDKVGLVAFAGSAVTLSPLTADKSALKMFVDALSPTAVSSQGTDFRRALSEAKTAFERGGADAGGDTSVGRLVLLVSDGEDNEPGALEAARELGNMGVKLFTLVVGTEAGGPIPIRDERGNVVDHLRNKKGEEVISKSKGDSLRELAKEGGGQFYFGSFGSDSIKEMVAEFNRLQKAQFDSMESTKYNEDYQPFLLLGILLALIEILMSDRRGPARLWRGRFEVNPS